MGGEKANGFGWMGWVENKEGVAWWFLGLAQVNASLCSRSLVR